MTIEAPSEHPERETLRFEPWDMLDDLFRTDIVLLMRHGPTDWSKLDAEGVAPTDCANQRVLSPEGAADMVDLGILLAGNGILPGKIVVSEWCRNQQTLAKLRTGFAAIDLDYESRIEVETKPEANLLLSLQGAPNVTELRALISSWTGDGYDGPLLIISHFTNIAELTEFNVYEGEMLVLDPKRSNRVLGYLRLRSAGPDVGHFNTDTSRDTTLIWPLYALTEGMMGAVWVFCWGIAAASGALVGAVLGLVVRLRHRSIAAFMSLGAGVLLPAASFKIASEALTLSGAASTTGGMIARAATFSIANAALVAAKD